MSVVKAEVKAEVKGEVKRAGRVFVGHAGWSLAQWRKGAWFPLNLRQAEEYNYYAQRMGACEINNTFYSFPSETAVLDWHKKAPSHLRYSIKLPRKLSHEANLSMAEMEQAWPTFKERVRGLGSHLGPVFIQLPPNFVCDVELLESLGPLLTTRGEPEPRVRVCFEFRHPSWFCSEVYDVLRRFDLGLVLVSHPKYPFVEEFTASDFVYIRLHGNRELHSTVYSESELREWAERCIKYARAGRDVYLIFNCELEGYGPKQAEQLQKIVDGLDDSILVKAKKTGLSRFFLGAGASAAPAAPKPTAPSLVKNEPAAAADAQPPPAAAPAEPELPPLLRGAMARPEAAASVREVVTAPIAVDDDDDDDDDDADGAKAKRGAHSVPSSSAEALLVDESSQQSRVSAASGASKRSAPQSSPAKRARGAAAAKQTASASSSPARGQITSFFQKLS